MRVPTHPLRRFLEAEYPNIHAKRGEYELPSDYAAVAQLTNLSTRTIHRVFSHPDIPLDTADRICCRLGVPTAYVLGSDYEEEL